MQDFEKLGAFYLGRRYDPEAQNATDELLLYDSKDLTTHAMCVGMTGSGKTGLCIGLLEEAAIDGIPALIIDPKGDLGNLLLQFPKLQPADFRPWVDEGAAMRKGETVDEFASSTATTWKNGLASWGQDAARVAMCKSAADYTIYTPGSEAGLPLTILRSFAAPPAELLADADAVRDRIMAAVSGLLALLGIDADPIQSREHILLSNILDQAWTSGKDLEIADLIREIQAPPFDKLGVIDLESFYPSKDRFALAMRLNNMLASPGFGAWLKGEPLDIGKLLYTSEGKPRHTILSIAHLNDAQRMFFVTIFLNEVLAWMRTQAGTSSLRAILYMDEIFGYFPPSANPPSKTPMLTLLKQARAYGLGCVLATQNPVDLDYKGLSNTGTWFLGRLQTERDKQRVLDGLEGATGSAGKKFKRKKIEKILSGLGSRVFLMNNVHDDEPVLFQTRWALSYLRGPLTRTQIATLMEPRKKQMLQAQPAVSQPVTDPALARAPQQTERPVVPPGVKQHFLATAGETGSQKRLVYRPAILGKTRLHFVSARAGIDEWRNVSLLAPIPDEELNVYWNESAVFDNGDIRLAKKSQSAASFSDLPAVATQKTSYKTWKSQLKNYLYQHQHMKLWKCRALKETSKPGETEADFRVRLKQAVFEKRDRDLEKLRVKYTPKVARLQERVRKAEAKVEAKKEAHKQSHFQTAISVGATLVGALFGRRSRSSLGRATTAMRGASRSSKKKGDVYRAEEDLEALVENLQELEREFELATETLKENADPSQVEIEEVLIRPRKSDISINTLGLAWTPWEVDSNGIAEPAYQTDT